MAVDNEKDKSIQATLNAFEREKTLLRKICKPPTRPDMIFPDDTLEAARGLKRYLSQCVTDIEDAYSENLNHFGKSFLLALSADHAIISKIQYATLKLMDQIIVAQECLDEPATFKPETIQALESLSNTCFGTVFDFIYRLGKELKQKGASVRKAREHSIGIRPVDATSRTPQLSPKTDTPRSMNFQSQTRSPVSLAEQSRFVGKPPRVIEDIPSGSRSTLYHHNASSMSSSRTDNARLSVVSAVSESPSTEQIQLISAEEVQRRLVKNEEFLKRRRQSKVEFHEELQAFSPTWISRTSPDEERKAGVWTLASTLKLPGFGVDVVEGMEAIKRESTSTDAPDGLILVNEPNGLTPTSTLSFDCTMGHDSSFYRYGGFCEGARMALKGEKPYKVIKRPEGSKMSSVYEEIGEDVPIVQHLGLYVAVVTARCLKCSYEVEWYAFKKDKLRDKSGIYSHEDLSVRYRQSFLSKSHLKAKNRQESIFACHFCVEENKTPEVHDATVFFTAAQLMRHIDIRHRQVPRVEGIKVSYIYGSNSEQDFDLSFTSPETSIDPFSNSSIEIASLPTAHAIQAHRPKSRSKFYPKDPNGDPTLQFAIDAQIAGIRFPSEFNGEWCSGYHDISKGLFPAEAVQLNPPPKNGIPINSKSSLVAMARWNHSPKNMSAGWLAFSRREKITHVEYPSAEHWCWSGQNSKGKWGFFPKDFVVAVESSKGEKAGTEREEGKGEGQKSRLRGMLSGFHSNSGDDGSGKGRKERRR